MNTSHGKVILINPNKIKNLIRGCDLADSECKILDLDHFNAWDNWLYQCSDIKNYEIVEININGTWKRNEYRIKDNILELVSVVNMLRKKDCYYLIPIPIDTLKNEDKSLPELCKSFDSIKNKQNVNNYENYYTLQRSYKRAVGSAFMGNKLFREKEKYDADGIMYIKNDIKDIEFEEDLENDIEIEELKGNINAPNFTKVINIDHIKEYKITINAPKATVILYHTYEKISKVICKKIIFDMDEIATLKTDEIENNGRGTVWNLYSLLGKEILLKGSSRLIIKKAHNPVKKTVEAGRASVDKGQTATSSLKGKTIVITGGMRSGSRNDFVKRYFEPNGIIFGGSITSKTSYLINNDIYSSSSKNKKAKTLGIPIITEDEFLQMI